MGTKTILHQTRMFFLVARLLEVLPMKAVKRSKHVLRGHYRFFLWNPTDSVVKRKKKEIKNMKRKIHMIVEFQKYNPDIESSAKKMHKCFAVCTVSNKTLKTQF